MSNLILHHMKKYEISGEALQTMLNIIQNLPYNQVGGVMAKLNQELAPQIKEMQEEEAAIKEREEKK